MSANKFFFIAACFFLAGTCHAWEIEHGEQNAVEIYNEGHLFGQLVLVNAPDHAPGAPHDHIAFPSLQTGEMLGTISFMNEWNDYRGQKIRPGTYVLRYAVQPILKDHQGVSEWRDFAILVPPDKKDDPNLLEAGRVSSGTSHPAVLSLVPATSNGEAKVVRNERSEAVLEANAAGIRIGFIIDGQSHASALVFLRPT